MYYTSTSRISLRHSTGMTLVELIISLSILGFIVGIALPSLTHLLNKTRADVAINQLKQLIYFARYKAIETGDFVVLCPSANDMKCSSNWYQTLLVFNDKNRNKVLDKNEKVFQTLDILNKGETLNLRASANKKYLMFNSLGITHGLFGNLTFCLPDQSLKSARRITINRAGRARIHKDLNGDGIIDGSKYSKIAC